MILYLTAAVLLAATVSADVICTDFVPQGDGMTGYYVKPLPGNCRGAHGPIANWKPTFKIEDAHSSCPAGWKPYKDACYKDMEVQKNFRDAEQDCNRHQAHIFVASNMEEMQWVASNVMIHGGHYWTGWFCAQSGTHEIGQGNVVTGEDTQQIQQKMPGVRGAHPIDEHNVPCWSWEKHGGHHKDWHHRHCHEGQHWVCEAPLG